MHCFNIVFFEKYKQIKRINIDSCDYVELHNSLDGKTVYEYLETTDVDRAFLFRCSTDRSFFENEFSNLDYDKFNRAKFIFETEESFNSYKIFLEYHRIEFILLYSEMSNEQKMVELCQILQCTKDKAQLVFDASIMCDEHEIINLPIANSETPCTLPKDLKLLSDILFELNEKTIKAEISQDALYSYAAYTRETHKKYAPQLISHLKILWKESKKNHTLEVDHLLEDYENYLRLEIQKLLFNFNSLPSATSLKVSTFGGKRYKNYVKPLFEKTKKFFAMKCNERQNIISFGKIIDMIHTTNVFFEQIKEMINCAQKDQVAADRLLDSDSTSDDLIYAARLFVLSVRLKRITLVFCEFSAETRKHYNEMQRIATELRLLNTGLSQIKYEYEEAFRGENELYSLRNVSLLSRKSKKLEKKIALERQNMLLNKLRKYIPDQDVNEDDYVNYAE
jgi:hypothetical protein